MKFPELQHFVNLFNPERLSEGEFTKGASVLPHTQLLFSTLTDGHIAAEAINPGPVKDQKTSFIGVGATEALTIAIFDQFLGNRPIDGEAKRLLVRNIFDILHGKNIIRKREDGGEEECRKSQIKIANDLRELGIENRRQLFLKVITPEDLIDKYSKELVHSNHELNACKN